MDTSKQIVWFFACLFAYAAGLNEGDDCTTPNNELAKCLPIRSCKVIFKEIQGASDDVKEFIRESQCAVIDDLPLVCCGTVGYRTVEKNETVPLDDRFNPLNPFGLFGSRPSYNNGNRKTTPKPYSPGFFGGNSGHNRPNFYDPYYEDIYFDNGFNRNDRGSKNGQSGRVPFVAGMNSFGEQNYGNNQYNGFSQNNNYNRPSNGYNSNEQFNRPNFGSGGNNFGNSRPNNQNLNQNRPNIGFSSNNQNSQNGNQNRPNNGFSSNNQNSQNNQNSRPSSNGSNRPTNNGQNNFNNRPSNGQNSNNQQSRPGGSGSINPRNSLLPSREECGRQSLGNRILNGEDADIDEFPWMALLEYQKNGRNLGFGCGGTLISPRYVLTAAHCVTGEINRSLGQLYRVRLGEYNKDSDDDCLPNSGCADPPINVRVESITPHPQYDDKSIDKYNDLALVRLDRNVPYSDFIKPICLPTKPTDRASVGDKLTVAGWGQTETRASSSRKQKILLPYADQKKCGTTYSQARVRLSDKQVCAGGEKGKDSCRGDSGGPLMKMVEGSLWYIEGIVSFGTVCGTQGWPGIYTRVSSYVDWIESNMKP